MSGIEMRFNGHNFTSASQLQRELTRSMEKQVEDNLKKAAAPGVRMKKDPRRLHLQGLARADRERRHGPPIRAQT